MMPFVIITAAPSHTRTSTSTHHNATRVGGAVHHHHPFLSSSKGTLVVHHCNSSAVWVSRTNTQKGAHSSTLLNWNSVACVLYLCTGKRCVEERSKQTIGFHESRPPRLRAPRALRLRRSSCHDARGARDKRRFMQGPVVWRLRRLFRRRPCARTGCRAGAARSGRLLRQSVRYRHRAGIPWLPH